MSIKGSLTCARYAFMPNRLSYCGPDKNRDLFEYTAYQKYDAGLDEILSGFETMHPYLAFIARENKISDPYDPRVVEAYWLGNDLLNNIELSKMYWHLLDDHKLKKRLSPQSLHYVTGKIPLGAKPHHSFHVFNIFRRTGHLAINHTLETMEKCRIGWGKVAKISGPSVTVNYQPLELQGYRLQLGKPKADKFLAKIDTKTFVPDLKIGDLVTLHWGWICDKISKAQMINLRKWTLYHLALANLTI